LIFYIGHPERAQRAEIHALIFLREMQEHPSLEWAALCMMFLSFWVMTTEWSRMGDWLMRNQLLESRGEML